ncbi:MAG: hypothetical protein PHY73_03535 [Candidatus Omnitrophica bacterium]|nr:hypothetical protein [Candidatus Omnitrophota bacterium]
MLKLKQRNYSRSIGFVFLGLLFVISSGCVTVKMPQYISPEKSYQRSFYAGYKEALNATIVALEKTGWKISKETHPFVFEKDEMSRDNEIRQVLILTNIRQKAMLLGSRYTTINVLVRESGQKTNIEIRYFSTLSTAIKNFDSYQNDSLVDQIFKLIADQLETK